MRYADACNWLQLDPAVELDLEAIKKAFHAAAIREHPDKSNRNDAKQRFQNVSHARDYLVQCVAKEETGLNAYEEDDEKKDDDFFYDDDSFDFPSHMFNAPMFSIFTNANGDMFLRVNVPSNFRNADPPKYWEEEEEELDYSRIEKNRRDREERAKEQMEKANEQMEKNYDEFVKEKKRQKEQDYDDFMESMYAQAKEKEEARRRQKEHLEKTKKQVKNQKHRHGKDKAPLLFEVAKVTGTANGELNGKKVRVIDFYNGMYVVELDATKKNARIKPEHLRPLNSTTKSKPILKSTTKTTSQTVKCSAGNMNEPKYIKIKVKCPIDKKPGDTFEIKNPHDPGGKKVLVTVPPNAQPKKMFAWMVPVAEKEKIVSLCAVCSLNLENVESTAIIALRSCPHSVCSQSCLLQIQGKCCLVCHKPNPTIESMQHLPYLQELHAPSSLQKKILEEYLCLCEFEAAKGTDLRDKLDRATEQVTKEVNKHYRKMSLKLHPDRHGEEFRPQFDLLTNARNVMIKVEMRRDYVEKMLEIVCKVHLSYLSQSHKYWIEKNKAEINEETHHEKKEAGKKPKHLQLKGGLLYDKPRKPRVSIWKNEERLIEVGLLVKDEYQFRSYCDEIVIVGSCDHMDEDQMRLGQVSKDTFCMEGGEIIVKLFLPEHGLWEIKWCMKVDMKVDKGGCVVVEEFESPFSEEATVDLRSKEQIDSLANLKSLKESVCHRVIFIQTMVRKYKKMQSQSIVRQEIVARYWEMHSIIANGRSLERKLISNFDKAKETHTSEFFSLQQVLEDVTEEKYKVEEIYESFLKKDRKKNFKVEVAGILETSKALHWMETVSRENLVEMRGEVNRLYQLLIEGKQANSLTFDGPTLEAASKRSDLFSSKQCDSLKKRAKDVEEQSIAEANRVAAERIQLEKETRERREMEAMSTLMPRNTLVRIHGLTCQMDLNGSIATFMGIAPKKRFCIRLFSGKEIALKDDNFSKWDESQSWESQQTANNNNTNIDAFKQTTIDPNSQADLKEKQVQKLKKLVEVEANDSKSSLIKKEKDVEIKSISVSKNKPNDHSQKQETMDVNEPIQEANKSQQANGVSYKVPMNAKRCKMGVECRFLRKGPMVCRFFHSQEEIAKVHRIKHSSETDTVHNQASMQPKSVSKQLDEPPTCSSFKEEKIQTVALHQQKVADLLLKLEHLESINGDLEEKLEDATETIKKFKELFHSLENLVRKKDADFENNSKELKETKMRLQNQEKEIISLLFSNKDFEKNINSLQGENISLKKTLEGLLHSKSNWKFESKNY